MVLINLLLTKLYCDVLVEELINLWTATGGCEQAEVWRTKSVARGSWDALKTHPNLCKPFLSKQRTTGGGNDMIIWRVPSLWHSVTSPRPLWKILATPLEHTRYGPPRRSLLSPTRFPFVACVWLKGKPYLKTTVTKNIWLEERKDEGFFLRCSWTNRLK